MTPPRGRLIIYSDLLTSRCCHRATESRAISCEARGTDWAGCKAEVLHRVLPAAPLLLVQGGRDNRLHMGQVRDNTLHLELHLGQVRDNRRHLGQVRDNRLHPKYIIKKQ